MARCVVAAALCDVSENFVGDHDPFIPTLARQWCSAYSSPDFHETAVNLSFIALERA